MSPHPRHLASVSTSVSYPDWLVRLRSVTIDAGITPYRLSKDTGLSQGNLGSLLAGDTSNPHKDTLKRLAAAVGKSLEWILSGDEIVEEIGLGLTQPEMDVLKACAYLGDSDPETLLREAVTRFVDARRSDPDVRDMLTSLQRNREKRQKE